ncbi:GNAT family N-acetyltransferase [Roseibium sp.]|uniref:GNAT family N-acetyltransferase n=1 Tax=Roseibium sp. TaxID=1936156 RepID=UPI003D145A77
MNSNPAPLEITIGQAVPGDAGELLALQRAAYQSDAEIYQDWTIAPLEETEAQSVQSLQTCQVFIARVSGRIAGSVRIELDGTLSKIGRLFVDPEMQGMGLGMSLMQAAEQTFSFATRFQLFTGSRSARNIALYHRLGYRLIAERKLNDKVTLAVLEKQKEG